MNQKTGHPAIDQHIPIFINVWLDPRGVKMLVYDLNRDKAPIGFWFVNWKGVARIAWTHLTRKQFTVFAGMSMDDVQAYLETGDRPLGYDG